MVSHMSRNLVETNIKRPDCVVQADLGGAGNALEFEGTNAPHLDRQLPCGEGLAQG